MQLKVQPVIFIISRSSCSEAIHEYWAIHPSCFVAVSVDVDSVQIYRSPPTVNIHYVVTFDPNFINNIVELTMSF